MAKYPQVIYEIDNVSSIVMTFKISITFSASDNTKESCVNWYGDD